MRYFRILFSVSTVSTVFTSKPIASSGRFSSIFLMKVMTMTDGDDCTGLSRWFDGSIYTIFRFPIVYNFSFCIVFCGGGLWHQPPIPTCWFLIEVIRQSPVLWEIFWVMKGWWFLNAKKIQKTEKFKQCKKCTALPSLSLSVPKTAKKERKKHCIALFVTNISLEF